MVGEGEPRVDRLRQKVLTMDATDFEHFIADLWEADGWDTQVTGETRDHGVDVIATKEDTVSHQVGIQAKCYSANKVSENELREYLGVKHQSNDIDAVVVATSSQFTNPAKSYAEEQNIKTINITDILDMVEATNSQWLVQKYAPANGNADTDVSRAEPESDESEFLASNEDRPERYRGLVGTLRRERDILIVKYYSIVHGESRDEIVERLRDR